MKVLLALWYYTHGGYQTLAMGPLKDSIPCTDECLALAGWLLVVIQQNMQWCIHTNQRVLEKIYLIYMAHAHLHKYTHYQTSMIQLNGCKGTVPPRGAGILLFDILVLCVWNITSDSFFDLCHNTHWQPQECHVLRMWMDC